MSASARAIAEANQRAASDPTVSAFVSASAGSGKTKLLTDRLLRLMLAGAEPSRIQCLTFTRAGAAEMRVRLQTKLGQWVMLDDARLDADLAALALEPNPELRSAARRLFGEVLDLPGGMRIETIHAFCSSLLRRFPLEAQLSPHFELLSDSDAAPLRSAAQDAALIGADEAIITTLAPQLAVESFGGLVERLRSRSEDLQAALAGGMEALITAQRRVLGVSPDDDETSVLRAAVAAMDLTALRIALSQVAEGLAERPHQRIGAKLPRAREWLAQGPPVDPALWHNWAGYFLNSGGSACGAGDLANAAAAKAYPGLRDVLLAEQGRAVATLNKLCALRVAALSAALIRLALPALEGYDRSKSAAGWLDYADLISRTRSLLRTPGAAWVLYKLDGGLDHLLLDEVQDTAPDQWRIADALTAEFFAGAGARDNTLPRSIFAVGDHKQSIYSFQGAAPEQFDTWQKHFQHQVDNVGQTWRDVTLDVSFRSTAPVLALVDAVFEDPRARMGVAGQDRLRHIADRAEHAGSVEVWPLLPRAAKLPEGSEERPQPEGPEALAVAVAAWIHQQLQSGVRLESRGRSLRAGDILVLVRNRGPFDQTLLRELKRLCVPVAGLDRMVLTDQAPVADLLALCDALLLPGDDLSVATVLTSPLGGLTDASLMDLALGRTRSLWDTLRGRAGERAEWRSAWAFVEKLFGRVDFVTPHALLSEALGPLGGRARLFARLGPQADEAIDELLNTALDFAQSQPPSLQGFVHWLRRSGAEVKREAGGIARAVRIMTVHGAKGLQAPVVILPAMVGLSSKTPNLVWATDVDRGGLVPLWGPRKDTHDAVIRATQARLIDSEREEHYRLLYVALTRAEDRLLVCGFVPGRAKHDCWYEVIRDAMARLPDAHATPFDRWPGERWMVSASQIAAPTQDAAARAVTAADLPDWVGADRGWIPRPPPDEPALPASLAPSRPEGAAQGPVPASASPLALRDAAGRRFRRGQLLHSLLQHLPSLAPGDRAAAATAFLARQLPPAEASALAAEMIALIEDPALAIVFGPGSRAEVPLTGIIDTEKGQVVVGGVIDRLVVLPDQIVIADYKTNRDPPRDAADIPALYRHQLSSYRRVLAKIYPGRAIRCALIWTRSGRVDWVEGIAD